MRGIEDPINIPVLQSNRMPFTMIRREPIAGQLWNWDWTSGLSDSRAQDSSCEAKLRGILPCRIPGRTSGPGHRGWSGTDLGSSTCQLCELIWLRASSVAGGHSSFTEFLSGLSYITEKQCPIHHQYLLMTDCFLEWQSLEYTYISSLPFWAVMANLGSSFLGRNLTLWTLIPHDS